MKPVAKAALLEAVQAFAGPEPEPDAHGPKEDRTLVKVPEGLEETVSLFLESVREDLQNLEHALRQADYSRIRFIGHDLKRSGGGYGFETTSVIGKLIEEAAKRCDAGEAGRQIAVLANYLERVEVV